MGRRGSWTGVSCPVARGADVLCDPWTIVLLRDAHAGLSRFDEFRAKLGIADNVLSARLGRMVETGLLARVPYRDGGRTRYEYRLTRAGADTLPVVHAVAHWAGAHTSSPSPAEPLRLVHLPCGNDTRPGAVCDHCGAPLHRGDLHRVETWRHGIDAPLAEPVPDVVNP
ncbi:winged helix-turn-helix transcriptional regulator [Amycolatopsis jiangsuensis]|uniref:DNA-binding HxlR family transcriptional regulator n=1 Tax=Amycolatopsis jiangsuensis TaxID=1181879 RepID=A0A840IX23_9PSEU|nr:helix-turn-helix domain-containing protein [Amycolatopsis jiangsuensis]MBB4685857.1 DNA-binding HxlR family transcriptional regulator [Amycolatopsis jiangsuensis]